MNIGIDIDGVLTDVETFEHEVGTKYFKKPIIDPYGYDLDSKFGVSKEEKTAFWNDTWFDYVDKGYFRSDASKITHRLHEEKNVLYIVSARNFNGERGFASAEEFDAKTILSLAKNDIYYDDYVKAVKPKVSEVEKYKIDVMIEDEPKNIEAISKVTKVIIFDCMYNRHLNLENTYRAHTWEEVYKIIAKLKGQ